MSQFVDRRGDALGDRMKGYEMAARTALPRRLPVIVRLDGRAFHTLTRGSVKPFDPQFMEWMDFTARAVCEDAQGAVLAYVQSDEISVLLHNYRRLQSEAWFDNQVQKIVSVAASIASVAFSRTSGKWAHFDARAFVLPEAEVCNYFVWRQQDATRNSVQMAARARFSHRECNEKSCSALQEMLHADGVNWNDYSADEKRGRCVLRETFERDGAVRHEWRVDRNTPIFTKNRAYIESALAVEEP